MTRRGAIARPLPPSSPAALVQATRALQEALGELAQRALCSADPAAVPAAQALVATLAAALPSAERGGSNGGLVGHALATREV